MCPCKKCGNLFSGPSKRRFCFECSPVGMIGGRLPVKEGTLLKCKVCGRGYAYCRRKGHITDKCNSCLVNGRREEVKRRAVDLMGGACVLCGYDKCLRSLDFHHVDSSKKEFNINAATAVLSWTRLEAELNKCRLLCKNCHGEVEEAIQNGSCPVLPPKYLKGHVAQWKSNRLITDRSQDRVLP
jgi:hypothetical protein